MLNLLHRWFIDQNGIISIFFSFFSFFDLLNSFNKDLLIFCEKKTSFRLRNQKHIMQTSSNLLPSLPATSTSFFSSLAESPFPAKKNYCHKYFEINKHGIKQDNSKFYLHFQPLQLLPYPNWQNLRHPRLRYLQQKPQHNTSKITSISCKTIADQLPSLPTSFSKAESPSPTFSSETAPLERP